MQVKMFKSQSCLLGLGPLFVENNCIRMTNVCSKNIPHVGQICLKRQDLLLDQVKRMKCALGERKAGEMCWF